MARINLIGLMAMILVVCSLAVAAIQADPVGTWKCEYNIGDQKRTSTLTIKKDGDKLSTEQPLFSLNEWHDVVIELKKGTLLLQIDGQKHIFESANIDMAGQHQIDFKAVDFGTCQIDRVQLWEGL